MFTLVFGTSAREYPLKTMTFVRWLCLTIYVMSGTYEPPCKKEHPISSVRFLYSFAWQWNLTLYSSWTLLHGTPCNVYTVVNEWVYLVRK